MAIQSILQALYYFLPAYFANMAPLLFRRTLQGLAKPIDNGATFRKKRVLGDNKTWRGVIMGVILAIVVAILQKAFSSSTRYLSLIDYSSKSWTYLALLGFLLGFGALLGDAVKSFFKRQAGVPPGKSFFPFDQLDFVIGGLAISSILFFPSWNAVLVLLILSPVLHVIVKFTGWLLHIEKTKF